MASQNIVNIGLGNGLLPVPPWAMIWTITESRVDV